MIRRIPLHHRIEPPTGADDNKRVPESVELRQAVRSAAMRMLTGVSRNQVVQREELERLGLALLETVGLSGEHLGFAMVAINNEFWRAQYANVPFGHRLLLLPHCMRDSRSCRGTYSPTGLSCADCGACRLSDLRHKAEDLGYKVMIAEGTPSVLKMVLVGQADAILAVACLDSLESAFSTVVKLGIPNVAVPLLADGCVDTRAEFDQIEFWLTLGTESGSAQPERTASYVPLLRAARDLFEPEVLEPLLNPELRSDAAVSDPLTGTEAIALDWLRAGGKRFRPFITLAAYAAEKFGTVAVHPGTDACDLFGEALKRAAVAVEALHKASLVHDDIEDDDQWRYGTRTIHERYDTPVAVNVGDFLIGLGYRLIAASRDELGGQCTADILGALTRAHLALSRGQGAELLWRFREVRELRPLDVLTGYALKTAPAFEAAVLVGLRAAGPIETRTERAVHSFCRYIGVGYQILNDLKDLEEDRYDKVLLGSDLVARRPTVLLAFALEDCGPERRKEVLDLLGSDMDDRTKAGELGRLFEACGVLEKARTLVQKHRQRAHAAAENTSPALRELMHLITDIVLK